MPPTISGVLLFYEEFFFAKGGFKMIQPSCFWIMFREERSVDTTKIAFV